MRDASRIVKKLKNHRFNLLEKRRVDENFDADKEPDSNPRATSDETLERGLHGERTNSLVLTGVLSLTGRELKSHLAIVRLDVARRARVNRRELAGERRRALGRFGTLWSEWPSDVVTSAHH